jgi:hypothetical protein
MSSPTRGSPPTAEGSQASTTAARITRPLIEPRQGQQALAQAAAIGARRRPVHRDHHGAVSQNLMTKYPAVEDTNKPANPRIFNTSFIMSPFRNAYDDKMGSRNLVSLGDAHCTGYQSTDGTTISQDHWKRPATALRDILSARGSHLNGQFLWAPCRPLEHSRGPSRRAAPLACHAVW